MILVDSSVWVDYLQGTATAQFEKLESLLGSTRLAIGDLILTDVLQDLRDEREFDPFVTHLGLKVVEASS